MPALKNKKHERFCREYVIDRNATQAAIRAKYSEKTAYSQGQRLLKKVEIESRIKELDDKKTDELEITQERILKEYAKLAFANSEDFFDWAEGVRVDKTGAELETGIVILKKKTEIPSKFLAAIQSIEETQQGIKIKLYDKKGALDSLAKIKGMFIDKQEITGKDGGPVETEFVVNFVKTRDDGE